MSASENLPRVLKVLTSEQQICDFMLPTWKKLEGHIVSGLFVCVSVHPFTPLPHFAYGQEQ